MMEHLMQLTPEEVREYIRTQQYTGPTAGLAKGYTQAN